MHPREILHRSKLDKKYAVAYTQLKRKIPKTCPSCAKDKKVEIWSILSSKYIINEDINFPDKKIYNYSCKECMYIFEWRSVEEYMHQFDIVDKLKILKAYKPQRFKSMMISIYFEDIDKYKRINKRLKDG